MGSCLKIVLIEVGIGARTRISGVILVVKKTKTLTTRPSIPPRAVFNGARGLAKQSKG